MEKVRGMLSGARLAREFWAKLVDTACYLVNPSPTSTLIDKTPHEEWIGKKRPPINISKFLVMMLKCMFQGRMRVSWTMKLKNVS